MSETQLFVKPPLLKTFLQALFQQTGMPVDDAAYSAQALVTTNLWGIDSHGVLRTPIYVQRLRTGAVNPRPNMRITGNDRALQLMDGDNGLGFVVGRAAMEQAINLARRFSIGAVGVVDSNHFGAAGLYARLAADQEMIGIVLTNVRPNMVAPGGSRPISGNNPLAIGAPTYGEFPFVLDISMSNAAGGKILLARQKGEKIPFDWATDRHGRPTDDPQEGFAGFLLPVGGHKGLGLSYAIDLLCGLLTGGAFQHDLRSMYAQPDDPSLTGHFMLVINPQAFLSKEALRQRLSDFYGTIHASPMWDRDQKMMIPGELEHQTAVERGRSGIPLSQSLVAELRTLGQDVGIEAPF